MEKEKFLELQSLAWDYNRRHPDKRVKIEEALDLDGIVLFGYYFKSYDDMRVDTVTYHIDRIEKILRS